MVNKHQQITCQRGARAHLRKLRYCLLNLLPASVLQFFGLGRYIWAFPPIKEIPSSPTDPYSYVLAARGMEVQSSQFLTYHARPKYAVDYKLSSDPVKERPEYAVVLQGPFLKIDDFTLETIKVYKKNFSGAHIVLSTWDDEDPASIACAQELGAHVVLSKKPEWAGIQNTNYQIVSSHQGLLKARDLGCQYAFKTRTDQRIYGINVLEYMLALQQSFPLAPEHRNAEARLIGSSLNTFKYRYYGVSDMFLFGTINDMLVYWGEAVDERRAPAPCPEDTPPGSMYASSYSRLCEIFFATEYLKKKNWPIAFTLEDSWKAFASYFCVVDASSLDIYWPKYELKHDRWKNYEPLFSMELSFAEWLILYSRLGNKIVPPDELLKRYGFIEPIVEMQA